ncbi:Uncharacterised protein [Mycobacteroides abscessus subsp. abscessus]|nr:Uncharacterised protein [Mycobacteroides abscessus subsp. abscessus]
MVVATLPVRISLDGGDLRTLRADLVAGGPRAHCQHQRRMNRIRMHHSPFQRAGAAHRTADDGRDLGDAQLGEGGDVGVHLVAHRDFGES